MTAITVPRERPTFPYIDFQLNHTLRSLLQFFPPSEQDRSSSPLRITPPVSPTIVLSPSTDGKSWDTRIINSDDQTIDSEEIEISHDGFTIKDHQYLWSEYPQKIQSFFQRRKEINPLTLLTSILIKANSQHQLHQIEQCFHQNYQRLSPNVYKEYKQAWSETWNLFISNQYQDVEKAETPFPFHGFRTRAMSGRMIEHIQIDSKWVSSLLLNKSSSDRKKVEQINTIP